MEQDSLLQRHQRVDVLDIGGASRYVIDDAIDLRLIEFHQRQQIRGDFGAVGAYRVGWGFEQVIVAMTQGCRQLVQAWRGENGAYISTQAQLPQAFDQCNRHQ